MFSFRRLELMDVDVVILLHFLLEIGLYRDSISSLIEPGVWVAQRERVD